MPRKIKFTILLASSVLFLSGIILLGKSLSRGGLFGYAASFVLLAALSRVRLKKQRFFFAASLAAIFVPIIIVVLGLKILLFIKMRFINPTGYSSIVSRFYQWGEALSIIRDFPVFGAGLNSYTNVISKYSISNVTGCYTHNCFLQIAAETGLLGLWAFLWILWRFFKRGAAAIGVAAKERLAHGNDFMLLGIMSGVAAILTQSFFDTDLFSLQLTMLFWVMLAVGTVFTVGSENRHPE